MSKKMTNSQALQSHISQNDKGVWVAKPSFYQISTPVKMVKNAKGVWEAK